MTPSLCLLLILLANMYCVYSVDPQYLDNFCLLTGKPPRDPNNKEQVNLLKRQQKCNLIMGGGGVGVFTYILNQNSVALVNTGIARITSNNLDKGSQPNIMAQFYANTLSKADQCIAGQILGARLGGSGSEATNIFPQSVDGKVAYDSLETQIYNCLSTSQAQAATLRWTFTYLLSTDTRPQKVLYHVTFTDGLGACADSITSAIHN